MSETLLSLSTLLNGSLVGGGEIVCSAVSFSTRTVQPGSLFVAVRGHSADGHTFIPQAAANGAVAAIVEDRQALGTLPGIVVPNSRVALSKLSDLFAGEPSRSLRVVGLTGTNGKTTTNWILYHLLNQLGSGCLRIGTLGTECMGRNGTAGELTSPDPVSIHRIMAEARDAGATSCVMEVSSHALDQSRVDDVRFEVGVFTNITRDHLDYHGTMESYLDAKRKLFDLVSLSKKGAQAAVINVDDPHGLELRNYALRLGLTDWSFGRSAEASIRIDSSREQENGTVLSLTERGAESAFELFLPFIGSHNVENVAAAVATCRALGHSMAEIGAQLTSVPQVPGRLERVGESEVRVFVDYAHTPDALERAVEAVRPSTKGRLWVVFGCGGDRDRGKRPQMGEIAARLADDAVVTSDNPRTEHPEAIIEDILVGCPTPRLAEPDRRRAIEFAVAEAKPGDTVLIAGKGHEDYQIIGKEKIYFSDQKIAATALNQR